MARNISITVIPTQIQNLRSTSVTQTTIALAWDVYPGATGYEIRRNGTLVQTWYSGTQTTYSNSGHTAGTSYTYAVRPVVGGSGVASAQASINVTTAGGAVIWQMDMSPGAAELAGWTTAQTEALLTRTYVAGGGPSGGNAYDLTHIVGVAGDNYYGWSRRELTENIATNGQSRFYRILFKWLAHSGGNIVNKMLIPHDSQNGNNERAIFQPQIDSTRILWGFQIDGGGSQLAIEAARQIDVWFAIQWEIRYSTAAGVADGYWKVWINNQNYATPTMQQTLVQNLPTGPNNNLMRLGYMNTGISSGSHSFRVAGVEVSGAFDSGWSA